MILPCTPAKQISWKWGVALYASFLPKSRAGFYNNVVFFQVEWERETCAVIPSWESPREESGISAFFTYYNRAKPVNPMEGKQGLASISAVPIDAVIQKIGRESDSWKSREMLLLREKSWPSACSCGCNGWENPEEMWGSSCSPYSPSRERRGEVSTAVPCGFLRDRMLYQFLFLDCSPELKQKWLRFFFMRWKTVGCGFFVHIYQEGEQERLLENEEGTHAFLQETVQRIVG